METVEDLAAHLEVLNQQGVAGMDEQQIMEHRKNILALSKQCKKALGQTSLKEHVYNDEEVMLYVQEILERGYALEQTKLAHNKRFIDAQHLARFKHIIKKAVQHSGFSYKAFKIDALAYQRSAIEQSATLHQLRLNVKAMIGPLQMYREFTAEPEPIQYEWSSEEQLLLEIEELKVQVAENRRIVEEMTSLYNVVLAEHKDKLSTITAIDAFKQEHNCSDEEACKVFKLSRSTLKRMRKEICVAL